MSGHGNRSGADADVADIEADVLAALEADGREASGGAFLRVAAEYYAGAWSGEGPVSPVSSAGSAGPLLAPPPRRGASLQEVADRLQRDVVARSNRLAHPMAMGHQVSPPLPPAVWAETVISALNQSLAVREMSPAGTEVERGLVTWLAGLAGLGPQAGGAFAGGGTEANFTALLAARAAALPDAWRSGVTAGPPGPVIVCGEHAHYSIARAAGQMGIGVDNVITVPARDFRMDVGALPGVLDGLAAEGRTIVAVVASAGSTATGSFDDIAAMADACAAHGAWLHVDAAHGGTSLLSDAHRHRLRGIDRADSVTWDPHKLMLVPIPCSVLLVRDEASLDAAFAQAAPYLFRGSAGRSEDQGVRSFACSRRLEALKLWVVLQRYGTDGLAALHDRLCRMASALHRRIEAHPSLVALHEPESNILCFRWTGADGQGEVAGDDVNLRLREAWNAAGEGWITTTVLGGRRVLRVTLMNPRTTESHLDRLVSGLDATARRLGP
ncbi:MAG TPA: pyridoxal-dependent decarboxylase [Longimicrobiales bacterium]|nr:pyridoxal-dependent decarboxylase [Longimicrobiales bacterium]